MRAADLPFCDQFRQIAGWNQTTTDWQRFLDLSPNGCFIAELDDAPVGTVTTISYHRDLAWIGMLLVEPTARRQGIGETLLQAALNHLKREKIACIKLDATPQGEGLYRKLGFQTECSLTRFESREPIHRAEQNPSIRDFLPADLPALIALDTSAFGVPRPQLIESLLKSARRTLLLERAGKIEAFGVLRAGSVADYLGPIVAESPSAAASLADALIHSRSDRPIYWDILATNPAALQLATNLHFTPARPLLRMFLGNPNPSSLASHYFAIADPSLG